MSPCEKPIKTQTQRMDSHHLFSKRPLSFHRSSQLNMYRMVQVDKFMYWLIFNPDPTEICQHRTLFTNYIHFSIFTRVKFSTCESAGPPPRSLLT